MITTPRFHDFEYISISSGLRAKLHITELRLASRAEVAKRGRELDAESLERRYPRLLNLSELTRLFLECESYYQQ